ncbi:MAG: glycosyltransferase [Bacteroidetes bacterium]|nr:glycosyltransferase [Bacteroidota bacterium]
MMIITKILFWLSVVAIIHSYILYPLILELLTFLRKDKIKIQYKENKKFPFVSILMSAYNEQEVLKIKVDSIFNTSYPLEKIEVLVGSDASTDTTEKILNHLSTEYKKLQFFSFKKRQGKPNVINQLSDKARGDILILTDANVLFDKTTIPNLIKPFSNKDIGLVDARMINKGMKKEGISKPEKFYISHEVNTKYKESILWGTMMGPFGGCYAVRKKLYSKVPDNYLVDDFYINMKVLEKGKKAINNLDAVVFEDVSNNLKDEFNRKVRIATGNFQNLKQFKHLLSFETKTIAFSFFSHKVLRWFGPFFLLIAFFSNLFLFYSTFYLYLFYLQCFVIILPFIDFLMRKIKLHVILLRFITHFYSMNIALFIGFFKYLKGVKTNVWQPTKRNQ